MLASLAKDAEAWGIEIDENTINPDNPLRDRIYDKPLGDRMYRSMRFDLITSLDVIEHIEDDHHAVGAMMHMLRPGGWLVITVPALPKLWTRHDDINKHYRRYTRDSLTQLLEPHGVLHDCRYLYASLTLPKLMIAAIEKNRPTEPKPAGLPAEPFNRMAQAWFTAELAIERHVPMPFGSSLIAVIQKPLPASIPMPRQTQANAYALSQPAARIAC